MKLIEIKQYSPYKYVPKSKEDLKGEERKKYTKRIFYGLGIIDVDSIVTVEPVVIYDEETLEATIDCYIIYFRDNGTKVYTDIEGYNMIQKFLYIIEEKDISFFDDELH